MRVRNPNTGDSYFQKRRRRFELPGEPREFTFTCFRRYKFLWRDRTREWFIEALAEAREKHQFELWAYVIMPEHVHLVVKPSKQNSKLGRVVGQIKESVARRAIKHLAEFSPVWLSRIEVQEGDRVRRRFWQPGGGFDRNVLEPRTAHQMIQYIHANPIRRGLVERPEDWRWSSAGWYAGLHPAPIEIDRTAPMDYVLGADG